MVGEVLALGIGQAGLCDVAFERLERAEVGDGDLVVVLGLGEGVAGRAVEAA